MKELEQKADLLIQQLIKCVDYDFKDILIEKEIIIQCAIQSVTHTIEVLENENKKLFQGTLLNEVINEQIELKKILENRS